MTAGTCAFTAGDLVTHRGSRFDGMVIDACPMHMFKVLWRDGSVSVVPGEELRRRPHA
ncbi:MAG: hypothetical protein WAV90_19285 [Gordonia amarae]